MPVKIEIPAMKRPNLPLLCVLLVSFYMMASNIGFCEEISVAVVGDMMFGPDVSRIMDIQGSQAPFADTTQILKGADITFGVLEGGITTRGEPSEETEHTFRSRPSTARGLANAGFDVVSLANPHVMDYGEEGFLDTMEYLSWYGVKYAGAGIGAKAAKKPVIITAQNARVAFLSYYKGGAFDSIFPRDDSPGPAFPVYGELDQDIADAKTQSDIVIVSMHWGFQMEEDDVTDRQKLYSRKLIDSGADAVLGQRLHTLQGVEIYKGKPIVHSLGDFIYGTYAKRIAISFIVRLVFSENKLDRLELIPLSTSDAKTGSYFPKQISGQAAQDAIARLSELSKEFGTKIQVKDDIGVIDLKPESP